MIKSKRKIHIVDGPTGNFSKLGDYEVRYHRSLRPLSRFRQLERSIALRLSRKSIVRYFDSSFSEFISENDIIIVFDSMTQDNVVELIDRHHIANRRIYFLWNSCKDTTIIGKLKITGWEIWTFDPKDARELKLLYGGQFMPSNIGGDICWNIESDIFFVGIDKGRFKILADMKERLAGSLRLNFRMVSPVKALFNRKYSARLPYGRCIEEAAKSNAILDLTQEKQAGLTLRVLEAFFLNKKIITNNRYIKNYSFFNCDNIFVLNGSDMQGLNEFISSGAGSNPDSLEKYTYKNWLERIIACKEMDDYRFA